MKLLLPFCLLIYLLSACNGGTGQPGTDLTDSMAPREATDPVPEPPTLPDTSGQAAGKEGRQEQKVTEPREIYYRVTGTEPFWSLNVASPYSTFRSIEGDSLSFPYVAPKTAAGRPDEWAQLYPLGDQGWVLLRKGRTACSDGMSDQNYAYTATLWLNDQLMDGCGEKR